MLRVSVENGSRLTFTSPDAEGEFAVAFHRTLRIPDDGKTYPLPPSLGEFPIRRVLAYADRVPPEWVKTSGVFLPMYQREAMWLSFRARSWRPNAVKVAAGKVNAVSGLPWSQTLAAATAGTQDYLTCPPQPWIDGFNTGHGSVRQFVAMPLGMGYTVEAQVTGKEEHGGVQLIVFEPQRGKFPTQPPPPPPRMRASASVGYGGGGGRYSAAPKPAGPPDGKAKAAAMGLGGGGRITQKIYPDPHGVDTWDEANFGRVFVHIVNSAMWREITGEAPPPTPVTAKSYTNAGFPWFDLYDEGRDDVPPSQQLAAVKSVTRMDAERGLVGADDDATVDVPPRQIRGTEVPDGEW
jgi:hypothetical protein